MRKSWKWSLSILGALIFIIGGMVYYLFWGKAVSIQQPKQIRIYRSMSIDKVLTLIEKEANLKYTGCFHWLAIKRGFNQVPHGYLTILPNMSLMELTSALRSLKYQTTKLTIIGGWDKKDLIKAVNKVIEIDTSEFRRKLNSNAYLSAFQLDSLNWHGLFIPNTYELSSNLTLEKFFEKMYKEQQIFWNAKRKQQLDSQKLTINEAINLASIITKESNKTKEYVNIAGVYLNRLRKPMLLQADPTVVYARGNTPGRVLNKHLRIVSPYNTYLNMGLPPGPLCIPNKEAIEAILSYTSHPYFYFCAASDFSGYHRFAATHAEHMVNARAFSKALDSLFLARRLEKQKAAQN